MPILDKNNKEQFDKYINYIKNYDGSSFMQDFAWSKVKCNWIPEGVYLEKDGNIIAAMTILLEKVPKINSYMMYAPRGPVCDIYDVEIVTKLIKEADVLAKKYNAFVCKFDPQIPFDEKLDKMYKEAKFKTSGKNPDKDLVIQPIHNMILDIYNKTEEELMKGFSEKTRYNIRLSARKGVEVRFSRSKEDLKKFYEIYKVTTVRDKIGCREYEYFERMLDAYEDNNLRIYIAEHEGETLAGAISTNYGGELYYVYGASSNEKRNLMPNYAMQMEMIRWGIETNCKTYNFGGLLTLGMDNGLYKFKIGFCKEEGLKKFIGEINKVYNYPLYIAYTKGLPAFRKISRKLKGSNTH